jgi:hypothetical protein
MMSSRDEIGNPYESADGQYPFGDAGPAVLIGSATPHVMDTNRGTDGRARASNRS